MKVTLASCLITPLLLLSGAGCSSTPNGNVEASTLSDLSGRFDLNTGADLASLAAPSEIMVTRVGDGATPLAGNTGAAVFIERRKIADGSAVGSAIAMPIAANGNNRPFTLSGTGISEGAITRSVDGRYVLLAGYDAAPGTAAILDNSQRVVGRVSADGSVDTSTSFDGLSGTGNSIRGAASTDGNALWVSGVLGIAYTTLGSAAVPIRLLGDPYNMRVIGIINDQLYASRSSVTAGGINTVGIGVPKTANTTAKQLPGFPSNNNVLSPFGFVAFDRDNVAGLDTLYIADDRTVSGGGVQRWHLKNNTWAMDGVLSTGVSSGARGLTGFMSGANIVLVATTSEPGGASTRLVSFTDNGSTAAGIMATTLATAAANTAFRGVCLAPTR